ncbi:ABC transporter permease [Brassicibacter mesophilus]|uniref:ABC transporter permease n=1 Tax=Brassicibacter mesophilus TaxID=745119 RepID=UPI003D20D2FE
MAKFILKRLTYGIFTIFIIITITFFLIHAVPGDPMGAGAKHLPENALNAFEAKYGLDKPVIVQYGMYLKRLILKGDLGDSLVYVGRSVNESIKKYAPISAVIGGQAFVFEIILGLGLGIIAALKRGKWLDQLIMFLVILGICIPGFVFASLLQYVFGVKAGILPIFGWGEYRHTILPSLALALGGIASYTKYMRNSTLGVIGEDYILTAEAKGLKSITIIWKHVIRNAIIPIITLIGPHILFIFTGAFVIESIFGIPGLGAYFVLSVNDSDYTMILGLTIFVAILYILSLILVDILYGIADPRIRVGKKK